MVVPSLIKGLSPMRGALLGCVLSYATGCTGDEGCVTGVFDLFGLLVGEEEFEWSLSFLWLPLKRFLNFGMVN